MNEPIGKASLHEVPQLQKSFKAFRKFFKATKKELIPFLKVVHEQMLTIIDDPNNYLCQYDYDNWHSIHRKIATASKCPRNNIKFISQLFCSHSKDIASGMDYVFYSSSLKDEAKQKLKELESMTMEANDWFINTTGRVDTIRSMGFKIKEESLFL